MELSEMTVEEFMKTDWGSDDSDAVQPEAQAPERSSTVDVPQQQVENAEDTGAPRKKKKKKRKKKSKVVLSSAELVPVPDGNEDPEEDTQQADSKLSSSHQKALDRLKEKDPEFYGFLQQEDNSLLHFDDVEFGLDDSSEEEETDGQEGVHKLPEKLEEASDSDMEHDGDEVLPKNDEGDGEEEQDSQHTGKYKERIPVTDGMIEAWKIKLMGPDSSLPALRDLMKALHAAISRFSKDDSDKKKKEKIIMKFKVESGGTFNAVVGLCIRQVVPSLMKLLDYYPEKSSKKQTLPSRCRFWARIRDTLRLYLQDIFELNNLLLEPSVLCASLRHTILLMPYFMSFPKITKVLLKFLVKSWSSADDESVRVLTFLCINRIIKLNKTRYLEPALKQCYLAYVANCKFTTPSLLPMINFMQQTLCELFAINPTMTYQLAFLYIRQLAIHLRKAITDPKKENHQAVYNWQYVHCLGLWCRMVGNLHSHEVIKPLLYPLVQISLGTIDLVPTARYFPLRYHIVCYLTTLSDVTNTYIPLLPYITKPLKLAEFSKKKGGVLTAPISFATILKLSNSQLKEPNYRSTTMDELYHALMEYIKTQVHTIAFPEMMVPTMIFLRKYVKNCKMPNYVKLIRQIIEKVEENSKFIFEKRSNVSFGVADVEATTAWEISLKNEGTPFQRQYQQYKRLRRRESQHEVADKGRIVEERLPTVDRKKFMDLAKKRDKEELGELFREDEDFANVEVDLERIITEGKARRKRKRLPIRDADDSDIDLKSFSEEDDELSEEDYEERIEGPGRRKKKSNKNDARPGVEKMPRKEVNDADEPDIVEEFHFSSEED